MRITTEVDRLDGFDMFTVYLAKNRDLAEYLRGLAEEAMEADPNWRICEACDEWIFPVFTFEPDPATGSRYTATPRETCQCGGKALDKATYTASLAVAS